MSTALQNLTARWARLAPREQTLLRLCAMVVGVALLWTFGISPAWQTLREADAAHARADTQLQRMRDMAQQAAALQSQARVNPAQARAAFDASVQATLGQRAKVSASGDRASVTFSGVPGEILARWLQQLRGSASARPAQAQIRRNAQGLWEGTVTVQLAGQAP